jgi:hypothetical protein
MAAGGSGGVGEVAALPPPAVPTSRLSANNSLLDLWAANLRVDSSVNLAAVGNSLASAGPNTTAEAAAMKSRASGGGQGSVASASAAAAPSLDRVEATPDMKFGAHGRVESFSFDFEM